MYKIVRLLKRNLPLAVETFQDRLTGDYGSLVARGPGLKRYVQSHGLIQGYRKGELLFDAIEEMYFDAAADHDRFMHSAEVAAAHSAAEGFVDGARTVLMPVDVHVIKDGPIPEDAVKNIELVNRRPGMALAPFRAYWRNIHGPIASRIPVLCRYEQNHLSAGAYGEDTAPPYDGLAITWFRSTADMKQGTTSPEYAETRADEANFLPDGHLPIIITRETSIV
jgi:uncharacterized protein (TIGR02118 family)